MVASDSAQSGPMPASPSPTPGPAPAPEETLLPPNSPPDEAPFGLPGSPVQRNSPFYLGFVGALGVFVAYFLVTAITTARQVIVLLVVSMFLAVGLSPAVDRLVARGMPRSRAVLIVGVGVLAVFVGFIAVVGPPVVQQTRDFAQSVPALLDKLQTNRTVRSLDTQYQIIDRLKAYVANGNLGQNAFGGIVGVGKVVLGAAFSVFTVLILTLYFLSALPTIKHSAYQLAPRSRRDRVRRLGDHILAGIGGYVSGALLVALTAGVTSFIFLLVLGLQFALALALLVALLDLIPMIGATIGASVVTLIAFIDSPTKGIACVVFYIIYQQVENYVVYPRVMRASVNVPPAVTVVAALLGAALLGVVGALIAIPTAAAILLLVREVWLPRQEAH